MPIHGKPGTPSHNTFPCWGRMASNPFDRVVRCSRHSSEFWPQGWRRWAFTSNELRVTPDARDRNALWHRAERRVGHRGCGKLETGILFGSCGLPDTTANTAEQSDTYCSMSFDGAYV